jgi:hypothetical protein
MISHWNAILGMEKLSVPSDEAEIAMRDKSRRGSRREE